MISFDTFKKQWDSVIPQKNGYIKLDIDHQLDLRVGYYSDLTKSLVIMNANQKSKIPSSEIVKVSFLDLSNDKLALEFRLLNDDFEDVYLKLSWDLIDASEDVKHPWSVLISRYIQWHKMLEARAKNKPMSFSKQKGLLGELLYLQEVLENTSGIDAVSSWKGPEGCDQDFQFGDTWTEVKAVSLAATSVKISSLEQLRQDVSGLLSVFVLEKSDAGDKLLDLPTTVATLKAILKSDSSALFRFDLKLMLAGYKMLDETEYSKNRFRFVEKREYTVDDKFPKLTKTQVPNEIDGAIYTLSFAGIEQYRRK